MTLARFATILALVSALAVTACANTVRGIGRDVNATADAVEDSVD
ncbi:MAG: EncA/B family entericidin [Rhizobiaceae bacterium]|nr:EncA/B family entericidin [Rhizobiaceae bacterium]MCV0407754.1 EncA/B family entericidin [Rhizobiaceae bacterium]